MGRTTTMTLPGGKKVKFNLPTQEKVITAPPKKAIQILEKQVVQLDKKYILIFFSRNTICV